MCAGVFWQLDGFSSVWIKNQVDCKHILRFPPPPPIVGDAVPVGGGEIYFLKFNYPDCLSPVVWRYAAQVLTHPGVCNSQIANDYSQCMCKTVTFWAELIKAHILNKWAKSFRSSIVHRHILHEILSVIYYSTNIYTYQSILWYTN